MTWKSNQLRFFEMKHFIFDIGKVLANFDFADFVRICSRHLGRPIEPFSAEELALRDEVETGRVDDAAWAACLNHKGLDWTEDHLVDAWAEMFSLNPTGRALFERAVDDPAVSVCTLSNIARHHVNALERKWPGFFAGADHLFLSFRIGIRKPDPGIYRHALERLDTDPGDCFFVDDLPENIAAARALGIHAHQFIPENHVAIQRTAADFLGWD